MVAGWDSRAPRGARELKLPVPVSAPPGARRAPRGARELKHHPVFRMLLGEMSCSARGT